MVMDKDKTTSFVVSAIFGFSIWGFSQSVTGEVEPWDADVKYYILSLFGVGIITGAVIPKNVWLVYLGVVFGQLLYMIIFIGSGPLLPLGVIVLCGYALISFAGAAFVARFRRSF
jgi:hypothetical protein